MSSNRIYLGAQRRPSQPQTSANWRKRGACDVPVLHANDVTEWLSGFIEPEKIWCWSACQLLQFWRLWRCEVEIDERREAWNLSTEVNIGFRDCEQVLKVQEWKFGHCQYSFLCNDKILGIWQSSTAAGCSVRPVIPMMRMSWYC